MTLTKGSLIARTGGRLAQWFGSPPASEFYRRLTTKLVELVAELDAPCTVIRPVVAPLGTVALICASESTVKDALLPLNLTACAPVKPEPLMVTRVPTRPRSGEKPLIDVATGGAVTVKLDELEAVPADASR